MSASTQPHRMHELCSYRKLIRHGNQMLYMDKSPQHMEMLQDFESLVDRFAEIQAIKTTYIEKTVRLREEELKAKVFGADGLIAFISAQILDTRKCEQFVWGGLTEDLAQDPIFNRIQPTHNVDLVIRTRFLHRTRDRIHDRVCEFLHLAIQGLLVDLKESFIGAGLAAGPEQQGQDVLPLLRLLDCLTWDKQIPDEDTFAMFATVKQEAANAIREIANKTMDMRVIKMAATVLGATALRAAPDGKDALALQNKFLIFAEAGNELVHGSGSSEEIECLKKSLTFMVDILPTKSTIKDSTEHSKYRWALPSSDGAAAPELRAETFFCPDDAKEDGAANQANDDDILACAADLVNNATTASASSGTEEQDNGQIKEKGAAANAPKEQKLRLSDAHVVKFDAGIEEFVAGWVKTIQQEKQEAKKAEEGDQMQIDQGANNDSTCEVTLREVAYRIFETAFKEKLQFLQDTFLAEDSGYTIAESSKQALQLVESYEKFKTKLYSQYAESVVSQIEARLILQSYIKDKHTLNVALEASIECQKRLPCRDDQLQRIFGGFLESHERAHALLTRDLVKQCEKLAARSQVDEAKGADFDAVQNAGYCIGFIQILSNVMKQVKSTGAKSYQAAHQGIKQLVLQKKDAADKSEKPFLLDLLTQISELQLVKENDGQYEVKTYQEQQEPSDQIADDLEEAPKFKPKAVVSKALLTDHRFQVHLWMVAQSLYTIASAMLKHDRPGQGMSQEIQQKFAKVKKEVENVAQKTLLKNPIVIVVESKDEIISDSSPERSHLLVHHDAVVNLITKFFIRSAWVTEGMAQQDPAQQRNDDNLQSLLKLLVLVVKASHGPVHLLRQLYCNERDFTGRAKGGQQLQVAIHRQDMAKIAVQLIKRLTLGPNHPEGYYATMLQSELFSGEVFGRIIEAPLVQKGSGHTILKASEAADFKPADQLFLSLMKRSLMRFLGVICDNEPGLISQVVENELLSRVLAANSDTLPITSLTQQTYVDFIRMVSVHEQGRRVIKESRLYEKVMMPKAVPSTDAEAGEEDLSYLQMVILSAVSERHREGTITSYQDLMRNSDDYFLNHTITAVQAIIAETKQAALRLQKKYYQRMYEIVKASKQEDAANPTCYRQFLLAIAEELTHENDYFFVKFQVDKLHQIFLPSHYDAGSLMALFHQVMNRERRQAFFELYEILTTIKPAYELTQNMPQAGQLGLFACLGQIIAVTIYRGHNGQPDVIRVFQEKFQAALQNLSDIVSKVNRKQGENEPSGAAIVGDFKMIDLYETLNKCDASDAEPIEHTGTIAAIDSKNLRGALTARALIVCQYCHAFELTRRETQQALAAGQWNVEMQTLQAFLSSITKCRFSNTVEFFQDQQKFIKMGVISQAQHEQLHVDFKKDISLKEKDKFDRNRRSVEDNLDLYRENLTFLNNEWQYIGRFLSAIHEHSRARRDDNDNRLNYSKLIVQRIRGYNIGEIVEELKVRKDDMNSSAFLANISHIYYYITQLNTLIQKEELQGVAFFEFVEQGCFTDLLELFNFLKMLKLKRYLAKRDEELEEPPKIKMVAYECIQSICFQIRSVLTYFLNCSSTLTTFSRPALADLLKDDGVYDSVQDFYVNFVFQMAASLTSREKKARKQELEDEPSKAQENPNASSLLDDIQQPSSLIEEGEPEVKSEGNEKSKSQVNEASGKIVKSASEKALQSAAGGYQEQFEKLSITSALYENRDLRQVQLLLMSSISNRFAKCRYLQNEYAERINRNAHADQRAAQDPRPHHNQALIEQLTSMGFSPVDARRALRLTHGEVNQAVGLLLQGLDGLDNVSDSEEEDQADQGAGLAAQRAREEELARKAEENRQARRAKRVTLKEFDQFVGKAQRLGLDVVTQWATFDAQDAQNVPYKKQKKFAKLYEQYLLNYVQQHQQGSERVKEVEQLFLKLFGAYTSNVEQLLGQAFEDDEKVFELISLMQDTKNKLHLIHRLARLDTLDGLMRRMKHDKSYSMLRLLHLMVKVVRFLVSQPQQVGDKSTLDKQIDLLVGKPEKTLYVYLSNLLELLYRSLQLFLVCEQSLISKQQKTQFRVQQLEKEQGSSKQPNLPAPDNDRQENAPNSYSYSSAGLFQYGYGGLGSGPSNSAGSRDAGPAPPGLPSSYKADIGKLKKKQKECQEELRQLNGFQIAQDSIKFVQKLKQAPLKLQRPNAAELHEVMAHIVDISRIISLEQIEEVEPESKDDQASVGKKEDNVATDQILGSSLVDQPEKVKKPAKKELDLQLMPGAHQTSGTATLNVLQVQKAAFNEKQLSIQVQHIITKLMEYRAIRRMQHVKSREQAEAFDDTKSEQSIKAEGPVGPQDSTQDFKKFITDFQAQVLGIGKGPAQQNQYRQAYGNRANNNQQNLSQPSNELANEVFTNILMQTIPKCCDVLVKHKKAQGPSQPSAPKKEGEEANKDAKAADGDQDRKATMLKPQNLKEAVTSSKIQLKQEVVERINGNREMLGVAESNEIGEESQDVQVYESVFQQLKESATYWLADIEEFVALQEADAKDIKMIVREEATDDFKKTLRVLTSTLDNWETLSMIALRNLSCLARANFHSSSQLVEAVASSYPDPELFPEQIAEKGQPSAPDNVLEWFKDVYLPIRLLERHQNLEKDPKDQEKPASIKIWFKIDGGNGTHFEQLERNTCLFLNEFTGYGHLFCDVAKVQRRKLRQNLIVSCLETMARYAQSEKSLNKFNLLEQAQTLSSIMIVHCLTNQYNQYEYNRVLLSRECYHDSIRMVFDWTHALAPDANGKTRKPLTFIRTCNKILSQAVKLPSKMEKGKSTKDQSEPKVSHSLQALATFVIECFVKTFTSVALYVEGEKKREQKLKEALRKKKERQQARQKRNAEKYGKKGGAADAKKREENKQGEPVEGREPEKSTGSAANANEEGSNVQPQPPSGENQEPEDALMNAESDDDDDEHGEGSNPILQQPNQPGPNRQFDLQDEDELHQQMLHQGLPPHQLEDDEDEDEPGEDDEDEAADDGLHEHHMHGHGPNNVLMNAEEGVGVNEEGVDFDDDMGDDMEIVDEDGDELGEEEEEENGDDLDDYEFDVESDDDRDVNALDPLYLQFGRQGGGRRGRGGQRDERDILFNQNDQGDHGGGGLYVGGYRNPPRLGGNAFARFDHGNFAHDDEYGRNWSREEEEVSQILRNLRGLQSQSDMNQRGHPPLLPHRMYGAGPPGSSVESHRYHIELEVNNPIQNNDEADPNNPGARRNTRKSIDQIKQEQAKASNNQISTIFQILKPLSLGSLCTIAQQIEHQFLQAQSKREQRRIEWEKEGDGEAEPALYNDDSDEELDASALHGLGGGEPAFMPPVGGLLRDMWPDGADPNELLQDRLMGIRMDIERLLFQDIGGGFNAGMPGFLRDPFEQDGLGYNGGLFGGGGPFGGGFGAGAGFPPRQQRDRDRAHPPNLQREAREQAIDWESSLFRQPEVSAQDAAQNLMHGLIQQEQVVVEEVAAPREEERKEDAENNVPPSRQRLHSSNSQYSLEEEDRHLVFPAGRPPAGQPNPAQAPLAGASNADAPADPGAAQLQQPGLREISEMVSSLRVGQGQQNANGQPGQALQASAAPLQQQREDELALQSFFSSLNQMGNNAQPNAQPPANNNAQAPVDNAQAQAQPVQPAEAQPSAVQDQAQDAQAQPSELAQQVAPENNAEPAQDGAEQNRPAGNSEANAGQEQNAGEPEAAADQREAGPESQSSNQLHGGMDGLNKALDDIREEMQGAPVQQQEDPVQSSLVDDLQVPAEQPIVPDQQQVQQPVAPALQEEEMTFGYPNSLLRQHDIEPSVLWEVPEEVRVEILSTIQEEFRDWQRAQEAAAQQRSNDLAGAEQRNQAGPTGAEFQVQPPILPPASQVVGLNQANEEPEEMIVPRSQLQNQAQAQPDQPNLQPDGNAQPAEGQANAEGQPEQPEANQAQPANPDEQAQPQPAEAPQQPPEQPAQQPPEQVEPLDPDVAQAIAMGMDPEFIENLPRDMLRELIQNEQLRSAQTGQQPPRPPPRQPDAMDVASLIASVEDPSLRREMLQNLSQEQIDALPSALRTEAINYRRGHMHGRYQFGGAGRGGHRDLHGEHAFRQRHHPREQIDNLLEQQMGIFMNRLHREDAHEDPYRHREILPDPTDQQNDEIVLAFTAELDQDLQDKDIMLPRQSRLANLIIEQLQEDNFSIPLSELRSTPESEQEDRLLKNILTAICLNQSVKADIVQFLRLIMKNKTDLPVQAQDGKKPQGQGDAQQGYQFRNKIINTLTFILQIAAKKDLPSLLAIFEVKVPADKMAEIKMSNLQWNRIFLTVTGIFRVLIDNNKKLVLHMLKCLIQRDDYFLNKGDQVISSHARLLAAALAEQTQIDSTGNQDASSLIKPPLAVIIQIMREESEKHHKLTREQQANNKEQDPKAQEELAASAKETIVRVRNIKLLIQDVIKQFDLLFDELLSHKDPKQKGQPSGAIGLGELSQDSVTSLTDLLYLPYIDKKLLTALGDFMYRLSNLHSLEEKPAGTSAVAQQRTIDRNRSNFLMITRQCELIGRENLKQLNEHLLKTQMTFGTYEVAAHLSLNRTPSQLERNPSQHSASGVEGQADQAMREEGLQGLALRDQGSAAESKVKKMTKEQEEEIRELLKQFKADSSPLMHVLSLHSYFFSKLSEDKAAAEEFISQLQKSIEETEKALAEVRKEREAQKMEEEKEQEKPSEGAEAVKDDGKAGDQKMAEEDSAAQASKEQDQKKEQAASGDDQMKVADGEQPKDAAKDEEGNAKIDREQAEKKEKAEAEKAADQKKQKKLDDDLRLLNEIEARLAQIEEFSQEVKRFFANDEISMLVQQLSRVLCIVQQTDMDVDDCAKTLLNCAFDCFIPEMQEEVVRAQKQKAKKTTSKKSSGDKDMPDDEDCMVQMEPIKKLAEIEAEAKERHEQIETDNLAPADLMKRTSSIRSAVHRPGTRSARSLVFRDVSTPSDRLFEFNDFCLVNKAILNKIVKNIYNASGNAQEQQENHQRELSTVSDYIKYMPNLLDFENKRMYFKKEIKKLRRQANARGLPLYIRRNNIFMDAYSQFSPLTADELKAKITVEFTGERGQDAGGLTRDFFIELSKEMFNVDYSLFLKSDNGSSYMPDSKSGVQGDHLRYFKFVGRAIAKALFEGCNLECYFVKSVYKMLIGQKLNFKDLEDFDNNLYMGLNWCLQPQSDMEALYETFSITNDYFGRPEVVDLIPGGRDIDVTSENKEYFVERKAYFHLYKNVQKQMDAFLEGFYELIPRELISVFTFKELELLISGMPDFKIADLKASTNYNGYTAASPQIIWFWEVMETLDRTEKGNFLQFVTGSSKVPIEGFDHLQGMNGPEKFQISKIVTRDPMRLPQGHTCFNQLDLPEYPSKDVLHERLMWAIKETSGFAFA